MRIMKSCFTIMALAFVFSVYGEIPQEFQGVVPSVKNADAVAASVDASIWPGLNFKEVSLFVYRAKERDGLLFHTTVLPPGFTKVTEGDTVFGYGAFPASTRACECVQALGNQLVGWIPLGRFKGLSEPRQIQLLYTGAFKVFEAYRGFGQSVYPGQAVIPKLDAENNALVRAEDAILIRMLSAPKGQIPSLAAAFLKLRGDRQAKLPLQVANYEWVKEVNGGLAAYAGYVARSKGDAVDTRRELLAGLNNAGRGGKGVWNARLDLSGCSIALALDRLGLPWKKDFERTKRKSLKPLLVKTAGSAEPADLAFINIGNLRKEEAEAIVRIKENRAAKIKEVTGVNGLVVVLNLSNALRMPGVKWSNRYVPNGVTEVGGEREVRESYYSLNGRGVLEFASSRPILIETRKSITAGFGEKQTPIITLNGKGLTLKAGQSLIGKLVITGNHFSLKVGNAKVLFANKVLTVTPLAVLSPESGG